MSSSDGVPASKVVAPEFLEGVGRGLGVGPSGRQLGNEEPDLGDLWGFEGTYYVLHADGTETRVPDQVPGVGGATAAISPDGSRVAFENEGLTVLDIESGWAVKLPYPADGGPWGPLTFSPDGTQIAYLSRHAVWVVIEAQWGASTAERVIDPSRPSGER